MRRRFLTAPVPAIAALALAAALTAAPAAAETYTFTLDPKATQITFLLDALLHKVHGTATLRRGEIRIDDQSGTATGEVVVDATSLETGNEGRDKDMHSKVLESSKFAEIVLAVDGYEGRFDPAAPSEVTVKGRFRIHGEDHPVALKMALKPETTGGARKLAASTTFAVPYVEWGLKDPSKVFLRVGKEVEVTIAAQGTLVGGG